MNLESYDQYSNKLTVKVIFVNWCTWINVIINQIKSFHHGKVISSKTSLTWSATMSDTNYYSVNCGSEQIDFGNDSWVEDCLSDDGI